MSTETALSFTADFRTFQKEDVAFDFLNEFFDLPKEIDIESSCTDCKIDYDVELEPRTWGIKSIAVLVKKATARFYFEVSKYDIEQYEHLFKGWWNEDRHTYSLEVELSSDKPCQPIRRMEETEPFEWKIENSVHPNADGQISIEGVNFDWREKTIYIN
jgi:hypothetical protein